MNTIQSIKEKYLVEGVKEDDLDYAIESVKRGSKKEHILANLTSDYRGMDFFKAGRLIDEVFEATGGEFKLENRGGYIYGALALIVGLTCSGYIFAVYTYGGVIVVPTLIFAGAIIGSLSGIVLIFKALAGKFRESDMV